MEPGDERARVKATSALKTFDEWFWQGTALSIYTRNEKRLNYLKANALFSDSLLRNFHFFCGVLCYCVETFYWYCAETWWKSPLVYFTGWGWYSYFFYCAVVSYAHIKFDLNMMPEPADSSSVWCLWKWCNVCFEIAFVNQALITVGFWVFIYPSYPWELILLDYIRHGVPLLLLTIDFHFNSCEVDPRHWVATVGWMVCYLVSLVAYQEHHDSAVYFEIDSFSVYFWTAVAACFLQVVTHFALVAYSAFAYAFFLPKG